MRGRCQRGRRLRGRGWRARRERTTGKGGYRRKYYIVFSAYVHVCNCACSSPVTFPPLAVCRLAPAAASLCARVLRFLCSALHSTLLHSKSRHAHLEVPVVLAADPDRGVLHRHQRHHDGVLVQGCRHLGRAVLSATCGHPAGRGRAGRRRRGRGSS